MIKADVPADEILGKLFEDFCESDTGKAVLSETGFSDDTQKFLLKNRVRRAFEAGYSKHKYG